MQNLYKILVCVTLGVMLTSCVWDTPVERTITINENAQLMYEPESDTHYTVFYETTDGSRISTSVPYIQESTKHQSYEIIDADSAGTYIKMSVRKYFGSRIQYTYFTFMEEEYQVILNFTDYAIFYIFTNLLPIDRSFSENLYQPTFELIDCSTTDLGKEECDGKEYLCTEVKTRLRVYQGEKVFDFEKTTKVREELCNISFVVTVNPWYENETQI